MTPEVVKGISDRYIELYEAVTGETFCREEHDDLAERIEKNVNAYLAQ